MSRWAVASGGCKPEVKQLPLKGTGEARCKPPRSPAWLRTYMASKQRNERPTGNGTPATLYLAYPASVTGSTGQRPHLMVLVVPEDDRSWLDAVTSSKDVRGQPDLPSDRSGFREERLGSIISSRLSASVEYIVVNVGGPCGEGSSPPMKRMGVGAAIVLGARESRVHGEGQQGIDIRSPNNQRSFGEVRMELGYPSRSDERETDDRCKAGSCQSLESRVR
jgi:hypothetical protein